MKILILLFLLVGYSLAQYENNLYTGDTRDFEGGTVGGWVGGSGGVVDVIDSTGGAEYNTLDPTSRYILRDTTTVGNDYATETITVVSGQTYMIKGDYSSGTGTNQQIQARNPTTSLVPRLDPTFDDDWHSFAVEHTWDATAGELRFMSDQGAGGPGDEIFFDNVFLMRRIDTLWIDAAQANDEDADSAKTMGEAFEKRGAHLGGTFLTVAGTYGESITIDSSFTEWTSTGGAVIITQVDFNDVTCTVDCNIYDNIGTVLRADNVTVTATCGSPDKHLRHKNRLNRLVK